MTGYALSLVFRRKLRTFLTSLGVTIAVILLSFIIFGMQDVKELFVNEFSARFNPNEIIVSKSSLPFSFGEEESDRQEAKDPVILTPEIVTQIESESLVESVDTNVLVNGFKVDIEDESKSVDPVFIAGWDITGEATFFVDYTGKEGDLSEGEAFISTYVLSNYDMTAEEVIGRTVILTPSPTSFFSTKSKDLLGKSYEYEIVGVVDPGQDRVDVIVNMDEGVTILSEIGGFDDNDEFLAAVGYDQLFVRAYSEDDIDELKTVLIDDYGLSVITADDILDFLSIIINGLTVALMMFGLIAAIVAAIGIINTMVMSIYEQTREIGIIKALGASNGQVLMIYLIQSGTVGLLGGVLGLFIVFVAMQLSDPFVVTLLEDAGFTLDTFFTFDLRLALILTGASIVVGILAGIYPALKAARLDPVKALRYE